MEQVVQALGGLLLRAVPTFVLVLLLYVFLKKVFFNPVEEILHRRYEATEGAMKAARVSLDEANLKTTQYQEAIKAARAEIYRAQERQRQRVLEECAEQVRGARAQAEEQVRGAREQLRGEVERAKTALAEETSPLAESIAQAVLKVKAEIAG